MTYTYLLCVRATNLKNFIDDTNDLKTIRGGSHSMILMPRAIDEHFKEIEAITLGASIGYYGIKNGDNGNIETIKSDISDFLKNHAVLQYATFVIASVEVPTNNKNLVELKEKLAIDCHKQKLQQLNVNVKFSVSNEICKIDGIRPANGQTRKKKLMQGEEPVPCSNSVAARRPEGHTEKHDEVYRRVLKKINKENLIDNKDFASDFNEIANPIHSDDVSKSLAKKLNGKMAVFYCDGNGFGKIIERIIDGKDFDKQIEIFKAFDEKTTQARDAFLCEMVEFFAEKNHTKFPLEVLMWGGDEMLFVVPACYGFDILKKLSKNLKNKTFEEQKITYGCGLVFCSSKAHIRRVKELAKALAECAKNTCREENLVAYEVMESFDYPAEDFDSFRAKRIPPQYKDTDPFIFKLDDIENFPIQERNNIYKNLPRGQMYKIVNAIYNNQNITEAYERLKNIIGQTKYNDILETLKQLPLFHNGNDEDRSKELLNICALWDYAIASEEQKVANNETV